MGERLYRANVKKCQAQLALAEKTLTRKKKLVDKEMSPMLSELNMT